MHPVSEALAAQLGLEPEAVSLVAAVAPGLGAARAGLLRFDLITHLDGRSPAGLTRFSEHIARKRPGAHLFLRIIRRGTSLDLAIPLPATPAGLEGGAEDVRTRLAEYRRWHGLYESAREKSRGDGKEGAGQEELLARTRELTLEARNATRVAVRASLLRRMHQFERRARKLSGERLGRLERKLKGRTEGITAPHRAGDKRIGACLTDLWQGFEVVRRTVKLQLGQRLAAMRSSLEERIDDVLREQKRWGPRHLEKEYRSLERKQARSETLLLRRLSRLGHDFERTLQEISKEKDQHLRTTLRELALALTEIELEGEKG